MATRADDLEQQVMDAMQARQPLPDPPEPPDPDPDLEPDPSAPTGQEPEPEPATPSSPEPPSPEPEPDTVTFQGRELPVDEARALLAFYDWAAQNQDLVEQFGRVMVGEAQITPLEQQQQQEQEQDDDELETLPAGVRAKLREFDEMREQFQSIQQQQFEEARNSHLSAIQQASSNFATRYGLDDDSLQTLQGELAQLGVLPLFIQGAGGDVVRGTEEALESAYFRVPENRQRELDRLASATRDADVRARKASKLAGSSGSTPRHPTPTDANGRREAMIEEIAAQLRGGEATS